MKQIVFEQRHKSEWQRFEQWLDRSGKQRGGKQNSAPADSLPDQEIPRTYRHICQLLALARERQYSPDLIDRLNRIALRGHHLLYGARGARSAPPLNFLAAGFPRLVRAEWRLVAAAAALFAGPLLVLLLVLPTFPDFIHYFVEPAGLARFQEMYDPANPRLGMRQSDDNLMMFAYYIWNNVKIGFQTFATGVLLGIGSVYYLLYNGAQIGAIAGHFSGAGFSEPFWSFVSGHSAMELTAIMLSGAAGLKLGVSIIAPGARSRQAALMESAKPAVRLMYGAALMFVIAAFIEGFWSPLATFPASTKYAVGAVMWAFVIAYFLFAGRRSAA
ncbi:MAG: stage II sporulation protein M [Betaproteobacteria bacterium]|nr:stage II sporulation protein M [Betaproteobacteria bacterium]